MAPTLNEARKVMMALSDEDREVLAEEIVNARWSPEWRAHWEAEAERRYARMVSGEDPGLTIEEFFSDHDE
jgi:hypothetical protein